MSGSAHIVLDEGTEPAPAWTVGRWFNSEHALQPADLRGKVIVLHAFQMLCPACVHHGLPQAQRIRAVFDAADVTVVGLHTVFEHHEAMTPVSLAAFLYENRIGFPVGVDAHADRSREPLPATMLAYGLQGTPTLILIDRQGRLARHAFGVEDDMTVGAAIARLVAQGC